MLVAGLNSLAQTSPKTMPMLGINDPWNNNELLEPAELAAIIRTDNSTKPLILNIGAVENIKGSRHIGPVSDAENLRRLDKMIANLPKNTEVIIYCGCCPFAKCPNIRPAFNELKKSGFTNVRLLNLPVNLKTNWIAKGYPLATE